MIFIVIVQDNEIEIYGMEAWVKFICKAKDDNCTRMLA